MKLKHLLEQLPPQEGEKDLAFTFYRSYMFEEVRHTEVINCIIDRVTIPGDKKTKVAIAAKLGISTSTLRKRMKFLKEGK